MKKDNKTEAARIREKAEELLKKKLSKTAEQPSETEIRKPLKAGTQFSETEIKKPLKVEELLKNKKGKAGAQISESDTLRLIHELKVHKIELELENEELKQATEALRESEENFRLIFEKNSSAIAIIEPDTTISMVNEEYCRVSGYKKQEVIGMSWTQQIPPEDLERLKEFNRRRLIDPKDATDKYEFKFRQKNGEIKHAFMSINMLSNRKMIASFVDITERKRNEEKIRYQANLLENVSDATIATDDKYNIQFWNKTAEEQYGWTASEVIGQPFEMFIINDYHGSSLDYVLKKISQDGYWKGEVTQNRRNGSRFPVISTVSVINNKANQTSGFIAVNRDITERKQAEEELKKIISLTEATIDSVHNGIIVVNQQRGVIKTNAKFAEMWRIPDDILASGDDKILMDNVLIQLSDPDEFTAKITELYEIHEAESLDLIYFKDGRIFERISKPMYIDSKPVGRVWSFLDITERKQAEEALRKSEENLRKLNAEKDKFFSLIAHDLRSPFQTLLSFSPMIAKEMSSITLEKIQKIAANMSNSANKLYDLLDNLLDWSLMQRGRSSFKPKPFLLSNRIAEITDMVRDAGDKKMIEISFDVPEDFSVIADAQMFESLMRNLIFNAVKFTPKGGKVTIAAKSMPDNSVEISIKDTGIGMNKYIIDNLFRLDEQTTRKGTEGEASTGLGLIICKDFIEKHGGKLRIESEEGKGSTFSFRIPERINVQ